MLDALNVLYLNVAYRVDLQAVGLLLMLVMSFFSVPLKILMLF
jgi:hypothetical protein